jgi:hypothetical protein
MLLLLMLLLLMLVLLMLQLLLHNIEYEIYTETVVRRLDAD